MMFQKFQRNEVRLTDGEFAKRRNLIKTYLSEFNVERLLYTFKKNAGIPTEAEPLGGWESPECGLRGHFVGHFLSACAKMANSDSDSALRKKTEVIVEILSQCAVEGGYLSAFEESVLDELEKEENRNIWAPYYTLHKILQGLIDCYQLLGNEKALDLAVNLANYIARRFEKLSHWKIDGMLRCTKLNPANEFGGIGEALYQLYDITKDPSVLKTAQLFDWDYFLEPLYRGEDILEDLHANTHLPMILAAMHRYEITGEEKYRIAAENFYRYLKGRTFANGNNSAKATHFIPGGVSEASEHWGGYQKLQDALTGGESESCCAHNTEKIAEKLFLWTGDREYLDHIERLKYNAVLNSASRVSGLSQYHQPIGRGKTKKFSSKYNTFWCCTASGMEAMSEVQKNIWFRSGEEILVNMFVPSIVTWNEKGVMIEQKTAYPCESIVRYVIHAKQPISFRFLWKEERINCVKCNEEPVKLDYKNRYCFLERTFHDGDTMELELHSGFHLEELPGDENRVALLFDQILMAAIEKEASPGAVSDRNGESVSETITDPLHQECLNAFIARENLPGSPKVRWMPLYQVEDETYTVYIDRENREEGLDEGKEVKDGSHAY